MALALRGTQRRVALSLLGALSANNGEPTTLAALIREAAGRIAASGEGTSLWPLHVDYRRILWEIGKYVTVQGPSGTQEMPNMVRILRMTGNQKEAYSRDYGVKA